MTSNSLKPMELSIDDATTIQDHLSSESAKPTIPCAPCESCEVISSSFEQELTSLLNRYSIENGSDTPDWILANFLTDCLKSWNNSVRLRESWYGRKPGLRTE